jgi:hypothetical protein
MTPIELLVKRNFAGSRVGDGNYPNSGRSDGVTAALRQSREARISLGTKEDLRFAAQARREDRGDSTEALGEGR